MRYKVRPADFVVEEHLQLRLRRTGPFTIYRVRKRGTTTLRVQAQMAARLSRSASDVIFPALKDRQAVAVQHAAFRGAGPARLTGEGYEAELIGYAARPLSPADIAANQFTVVLRDLMPIEAAHIENRLAQIRQSGVPNYFDDQRFGSMAPGADHIGKRILLRDAEGAVRAYLTQPFTGDPDGVRRFKTVAAGCWEDWQAMFDAAPRPSNYRSVLTYLRDHPVGSAEPKTIYRKALNLINRRLLSVYLTAYQSLLWNRIAARFLVSYLQPVRLRVQIAGEEQPLYEERPAGIAPDVAIPLPHHRATFDRPELAAISGQVLAEQGLDQRDLKARILKHAYLPHANRALFLFPQDVSVTPREPDDLFTDRSKMTLRFNLPRGSYATLLLKALAV